MTVKQMMAQWMYVKEVPELVVKGTPQKIQETLQTHRRVILIYFSDYAKPHQRLMKFYEYVPEKEYKSYQSMCIKARWEIVKAGYKYETSLNEEKMKKLGISY